MPHLFFALSLLLDLRRGSLIITSVNPEPRPLTLILHPQKERHRVCKTTEDGYFSHPLTLGQGHGRRYVTASVVGL